MHNLHYSLCSVYRMFELLSISLLSAICTTSISGGRVLSHSGGRVVLSQDALFHAFAQLPAFGFIPSARVYNLLQPPEEMRGIKQRVHNTVDDAIIVTEWTSVVVLMH